MNSNPSPSFACLPLLALMACCSIIGAGCPDESGDCLSAGTCECMTAEQCPSGEHCVDGSCRRVMGPDLPQRDFGDPCLLDTDCRTDICLPGGPGNGEVCTRACDEEPCPSGWECKADLLAESARSVCVQQITSRLCQACSVNAQCNAAGDLCLELSGTFSCARDCSLETCPQGYACTDVPVAAGLARQCLPEGGTCDCGLATIGLTRPCQLANEYGVCHGQQHCREAEPQPAWGPCDSPPPAAEVCNGLDDDCDGLTDAWDPSVDVSELPTDPPYPSCSKGSAESQCIGLWHCQPDGGADWAWICGAGDPQAEICNGRDDNCDGVADDPFLDAEGRYAVVEHCGGCGTDCRTVLPNLRIDDDGQVLPGAAVCQIREGQPACVPLQCIPGYYPFPEDRPVSCARLVSPACQKCSQDDDCRISSDRCIAIGQDPGGHCAQSCEPASPYTDCTGELGVQSCCPEDFSCEFFQGQRLCLPISGSCTCDAERVGQTRSCFIGGGAGEVCQGAQTCRPEGQDFAWTECEQSDVVVEVCDHLDNNCDGHVDEGFRDADGAYTTDEHCGDCNINCLARWNQEIQHAIGGCVPEGLSLTCQIVACTVEDYMDYEPTDVLDQGTCRREEDCIPGLICDPVLHYCIPDPANPGQCPGGLCGSPYEQTFQFVNTNGLDVDGCECAAIIDEGPDEPDTSTDYPEPGWVYVDRDCDGIDGVESSSLFVWSGSEQSLGTRAAPHSTIAEAIATFDPNVHTSILVAAGTYRENVVLENGLKLHGGYSADFSKRDVVLYPSLIVGQEPDHAQPNHRPGTINADGLSGQTVLSGFTIQGYDVNFDPQPGQAAPNSYALFIHDCGEGLQISNNFILGGRGGDGAGSSTGVSGGNGDDGLAGRDSRECPGSIDCGGQTNQGGTGGQSGACVGTSGNPGATARGYDYDQNPQDYQGGAINGQGGYDSTYAHSDEVDQADLCKYDCQVGAGSSNNGGDARAGAQGSGGDGGAGCSQAKGRIVDTTWQAVAAGSGAAGIAGAGGGGGGAGGAVINLNEGLDPPCTQGNPYGDLGGSGGGGGAGGCGATGGGHGGGGGGSFSVFVTFSAQPQGLPQVFGNRIRRGFGGAGGAGGAGGQGGLGGQGGDGGEIVWPAWCAGAGGRGGRGGDGGAGGGGGGACGGVSYGLAGRYIDGAPYGGQNQYEVPGTPDTGGAGGAGGSSPAGNAGSAGETGQAGDLGLF